MRDTIVELRDGLKIVGDYFDDEDFNKMREIFIEWQNINDELKSLKGRTLNVPDVISEGIYCYLFNAVRTNGVAHSYDAVNIDNRAGVQVKSTSIDEDLTSFGPRSTWDELWFMDFAPDGEVDGKIDIYKIDDKDIMGLILNKRKGETFADQQAQGRRPRFSIKKEIIKKEGLIPYASIDLLDKSSVKTI